MLQERNTRQSEDLDMHVPAGALSTAPFELNHALIDSIIQQQHRRVACIPTEQEEADALLWALATSLVTAGNTTPGKTCRATSSVTEPRAWLEPATSIAHSLESASNEARQPGSPLQCPCTELRAQGGSPRNLASDDHHSAFFRAPATVQDLDVFEAGLENAPATSGTTPERSASHTPQSVCLSRCCLICAYACMAPMCETRVPHPLFASHTRSLDLNSWQSTP